MILTFNINTYIKITKANKTVTAKRSLAKLAMQAITITNNTGRLTPILFFNSFCKQNGLFTDIIKYQPNDYKSYSHENPVQISENYLANACGSCNYNIRQVPLQLTQQVDFVCTKNH